MNRPAQRKIDLVPAWAKELNERVELSREFMGFSVIEFEPFAYITRASRDTVRGRIAVLSGATRLDLVFSLTRHGDEDRLSWIIAVKARNAAGDIVGDERIAVGAPSKASPFPDPHAILGEILSTPGLAPFFEGRRLAEIFR
jgi:hypothetical protein